MASSPIIPISVAVVDNLAPAPVSAARLLFAAVRYGLAILQCGKMA